MRNPTRAPWATMEDHPMDGDPWEGLATKVVPAAGRIAEGFEPDSESPAGHMNYLLHRLGLLVDELETAPLLAWREANTAALVTFTLADVLAGCVQWHDTSRKRLTFLDADGETMVDKDPGYSVDTPGGNGVLWRDEADTPNNSLTWVAAATRAAIATRYEQAANPERLAVSDSAAAQVAWSSAYDAWSNTPPTGISGVAWSACEYGDGTWVIGGAGGAIRTSTDVPGSGFTTRTSGLSGVVIRIRSNRKTGAAHRFMALDDTGAVAVSSDGGLTWTAYAPGLTSTIEDLTWDAAADRWMGIQYDGNRAWSEDDGATWTESGSPGLEGFIPSANNFFHLDADDQGHILLVVFNVASWSFFNVSPDSGETWRSAYYENQFNFGRVALMGPGRGVAVGAAGVLISDPTLATRRAGA